MKNENYTWTDLIQKVKEVLAHYAHISWHLLQTVVKMALKRYVGLRKVHANASLTPLNAAAIPGKECLSKGCGESKPQNALLTRNSSNENQNTPSKPQSRDSSLSTRAVSSTAMPAERGTTSAYGRQVKECTNLICDFLENHYELRYNVVDGLAEMRLKPEGCKEKPIAECSFQPISPLMLNTLVLRMHKNSIPCWDRDVSRILQSLTLKQYHPLHDYIAHLPAWDGKDRLTPLAERISNDGLWVRTFSSWMRAMVRQWQMCLIKYEIPDTEAIGGSQRMAESIPGSDNGPDAELPVQRSLSKAPNKAIRATKSSLTGNGAAKRSKVPASNQLSPILISREQGMHKSSFCRLLLPPELRNYFTDKFELSSRSGLEFPLCRYALINLDEFDRYTAGQMAKLKNLMQLSVLNVRRPHARHYETMHRTASFIATSNTGELLTDPSGSRRFICQEVDHMIDCSTPVDYQQLYAQIVAELDTGMPYYPTKDDEAAIQQHNRRYYKASALREAFIQTFGLTKRDENDEQVWMSATAIFKLLQQQFGTHILTGTPSQLGRELTFLQIPKKHTEGGTIYQVNHVGKESEK